ncbi:MAG: nuclear transport factor 2 family protein [Gemmatimonadota bacterium]|nr:nuclear transport factor 2 family protein [Gemmatimonadota bacterium]
MRRLALTLALFALPAAMPAVLRAQSDDQQQVVAAVTKFFDGMRKRDTSLIRSVIDSNAVLMGPGERNGVVHVRSMAAQDFMKAIAGSKGGNWDERIYAPEVRIADYLATVWAEYDFYIGTAFHHCGVDAFQLAKTAGSWKIFQIADTEKDKNCPKR